VHVALVVQQFDPQRLVEPLDRVLGTAVGTLQRDAAVGQRRADLHDHAAVDEAAAQVEKDLGPIDLWVNDAFSSVFARFVDIDMAEFRRTTEVSYLGYVHGTKAALNRMLPRDRGVIVQVGSALAYRGIPLQSAYCGAKIK